MPMVPEKAIAPFEGETHRVECSDGRVVTVRFIDRDRIRYIEKKMGPRAITSAFLTGEGQDGIIITASA